jgi:hypothetical protein
MNTKNTKLEGFAKQFLPDELVLGYILLARDPLFRRMSQEMRFKIIKCATLIGKIVAQNIWKELGTKDPVMLAKKLGIKIVISDEEYIMGSAIQFSEYWHNHSTIIVYEKFIWELAKWLNRGNLAHPIVVEDLRSACVAHELFHFIEETRVGSLREKFKVCTLAIGPIRIKSGVMTASELAAHAFTKELLSMKFSPILIDYLVSLIHPEILRLNH